MLREPVSEENVIELARRKRARWVRLRPAQSPEEAHELQALQQELSRAAAADNHTVLGPTHVVLRDGEVVGYCSAGGLPTVHVWLDSKQVHAAESLRLLETLEAILSDNGVRAILMPCDGNSPFSSHMERLGFTKLGTTVLYVKTL